MGQARTKKEITKRVLHSEFAMDIFKWIEVLEVKDELFSHEKYSFARISTLEKYLKKPKQNIIEYLNYLHKLKMLTKMRRGKRHTEYKVRWGGVVSLFFEELLAEKDLVAAFSETNKRLNGEEFVSLLKSLKANPYFERFFSCSMKPTLGECGNFHNLFHIFFPHTCAVFPSVRKSESLPVFADKDMERLYNDLVFLGESYANLSISASAAWTFFRIGTKEKL